MEVATEPKIKNVGQLKAWIKANHARVAQVIALELFAQSERARVNSYLQPIWDRYNFGTKNMEDAYLIDGRDDDLAKFYEETYVANAAHGWTGPREQCPALVANMNFVFAQRDLVKDFFGCDVDLIGAQKTAWQLLKNLHNTYKTLG
jgi:hypothetical protein